MIDVVTSHSSKCACEAPVAMFPSKLNSPRLSKPLAGPSGQIRLERPFLSYAGPLADFVQTFSGYRMDFLPVSDVSDFPSLPRPSGERIVRPPAAVASSPRLFNPPVVETVALSSLLSDASPFEKFVIEPLTDLALFESVVLLPEAASLPPAISITVISGPLMQSCVRRGISAAPVLKANLSRAPFLQ